MRCPIRLKFNYDIFLLRNNCFDEKYQETLMVRLKSFQKNCGKTK